jgi:signal transduction histidine kinase
VPVLDDADRPPGAAPASPRSTLVPITTDASRRLASKSSRATTLGGMPIRIRQRILTFLGGIRLRMVWWFIVVLALATAGSVILVRQVLVQRLDARIEAELVQEVDEVRRLADGNDPETGEPFGGRVDRIFEVFLARNIPARHEMLLTFIDGELHRYSPQDEAAPLDEVHVPYPLHEDRALAARWANVEQPDRGRADTPAGAIEYLAVPFRVNGEPRGVFVVASFRELQQADTDAASVAAAIVGIVMLVIGSILAIRLAERILAPVRLVTGTARSISETDLRQRIPVRGYDEISELSATFNEMLERLDGAFATQRRFIDDAGHELRTPITVIRGHLDVMGDDPDDRRRTLELVSEELERMSRMVDDLLTLARTEQPDFLRSRVVDLDELTIRMFENARGLAPRDWRLEGAADGRATVDEQRLMQAVLQLAANAVRHTADGELVALGSAIRDGEVRFWVRDSGPGVAPEDRDRIFERFYRGRSGHRRSDGAGLGLSIVRAIAEAHGGRVELDSRPGAGATFTVVVPVDQQGRPM